jgi:hypothetical protein
VTLSGGTVRKYANGRLLGQSSGAVIIAPVELPNIGHPSADSMNNYHWYLDEIRERDVAADSAAISLSYENQRRDSRMLLLGGLSCIEPRILIEPVNDTVQAGETAFFSVTATGTNLRYQWYKGFRPIAGRTASSLSFPTADSLIDSSFTFFCAVQGDCGASIMSRTVALKVLPTGVLPRPRGLAAARTAARFMVYDVSGRLLASPARRPAALPAGVRFVATAGVGGLRVTRCVETR